MSDNFTTIAGRHSQVALRGCWALSTKSPPEKCVSPPIKILAESVLLRQDSKSQKKNLGSHCYTEGLIWSNRGHLLSARDRRNHSLVSLFTALSFRFPLMLLTEPAKTLLEVSLSGKSSTKKLQRLRLLSTILRIGKAQSVYERVDNGEAVESAATQIILSYFGVADPRLLSRVHKTFGLHDDALVYLCTYYEGLLSLGEKGRIPVQLFVLFINEVLTGTFIENRYRSDFLDRIFARDPFLAEEWKRGGSRMLHTSSFGGVVTSETKMVECVRRGFPLQDIQLALEYLESGESNRREAIYTEVHTLAGSQGGAYLVQRELIRFFREGRSRLKWLEMTINSHYGDRKPAFSNVLAPWKSSQNHFNGNRLHFLDTDDFWILFKMGTDVPDCMRIGGDPEHNHLLVGSVLDGRNRLITLYDPDKRKILMVAQLFLYERSDTGEPVLFLDKITSVAPHEEVRRQFVEFAKARARKLGYPLYGLPNQKYPGAEGEEEIFHLESKGTRIGCQYNLPALYPSYQKIC